jgi:hypothetical protein
MVLGKVVTTALKYGRTLLQEIHMTSRAIICGIALQSGTILLAQTGVMLDTSVTTAWNGHWWADVVKNAQGGYVWNYFDLLVRCDEEGMLSQAWSSGEVIRDMDITNAGTVQMVLEDGAGMVDLLTGIGSADRFSLPGNPDGTYWIKQMRLQDESTLVLGRAYWNSNGVYKGAVLLVYRGADGQVIWSRALTLADGAEAGDLAPGNVIVHSDGSIWIMMFNPIEDYFCLVRMDLTGGVVQSFKYEAPDLSPWYPGLVSPKKELMSETGNGDLLLLVGGRYLLQIHEDGGIVWQEEIGESETGYTIAQYGALYPRSDGTCLMVVDGGTNGWAGAYLIAKFNDQGQFLWTVRTNEPGQAVNLRAVAFDGQTERLAVVGTSLSRPFLRLAPDSSSLACSVDTIEMFSWPGTWVAMPPEIIDSAFQLTVDTEPLMFLSRATQAHEVCDLSVDLAASPLNEKIHVFPDPFTTEFVVSCGQEQLIDLRVFDIQGRRIKARIVGSGSSSFRVQLLDAPVSGTFLVHVRTASGVLVQRVVRVP